MRIKNSCSNNSEQDKKCEQCELLKKELQEIKLMYTKYELTLQNYGLIEKASDITDTEAICVEQIKKLKAKSAIAAFSETDSKVLDLLHKNLRVARGEKVEEGKKGKTKNLSNEDLLTLIKTEN
jgi:hypothetical protein